MNLRDTQIRISFLVATFLVGVLSSALMSGSQGVESLPSVAEQREENLHRLFEAARLSKDDVLISDVTGRLQCMDASESLENRLIFEECVQPSGEHYKVIYFTSDHPYDRITKHHREWWYKNAAFDAQYSDPTKAAIYVKQQLGY
jgi:hypothetical protein